MTGRNLAGSIVALLLAGIAHAAAENPLAAFAMQPGAAALSSGATVGAVPGFSAPILSGPTAAPMNAAAGTASVTQPHSIAISPAAALPPLARSKEATLSPSEREAYRSVFAALRAHDWSSAATQLDALPNGLLTPVARAELYLAKGSPKVDPALLAQLLTIAPELPQASQLARIASGHGVVELPPLPSEHELYRLAGPSRRHNARATESDTAAARLAVAAAPLIKSDQPAAMEALLTAATDLSADARTEWQARTAWAYYFVGDDVNARRLSGQAQAGMGEWAAEGDWLQGLSAWRQHDYAAAETAFARTALRARDVEMIAAGQFWSARAAMAAGHPDQVAPRLRAASRSPETFYGMIAAGELGMAVPTTRATPDDAGFDTALEARRSNLRVARALVDVGERGLADAVLRRQARIGDGNEHCALIHLAARLELPATQIWLAQNGPAGAKLTDDMRFPAPNWAPQGGWRVDRALVFAHTLQESQFRTDAVSAAGARGLMQVRLGTAQDIARKRGGMVDAATLAEPAANLEYGQSYLEQLRDMPGIDGRLPKVIAAYNAGPTPVVRWTMAAHDPNDPLLFIESIPYRETRGYVVTVLRNYWMYQREAGAQSPSLKAIAQGQWPGFPSLGAAHASAADRYAMTGTR